VHAWRKNRTRKRWEYHGMLTHDDLESSHGQLVHGGRRQAAATTGDSSFPECQMHSGKGHKHSGKPSPSATLGEEPPGMPLTGKRPSPSAKNRTLGEASPECHPSTRGSFDAVGTVHPRFF
jgi:hypothetical protein